MKVSRAVISARAMARMKTEANKGLPDESGGILVGRFELDQVVISEAGDPGPRARRTRAGFRRDGDHSQRLLDMAVSRNGGRVDYVGEWHSHPEDCKASPTDESSIEGVSKNPNYKRTHPILIVLRHRKRGWKVDASQFAGGRLVPLELTTRRVRKTSQTRRRRC